MNDRLTANDWIDLALSTLAREGAVALKADVLARTLKVSRGSFYWHFRDLPAFHAAVIARWRELATEAIISDVEQRALPPDRLEALLRRAFGHDGRIELHLRAWAAQHADAARAIADVDRRRRGYIERLLTDGGVPEADARTRASILYWAYLGAITARSTLTGGELDRIVAELKCVGLAAHSDTSAPRTPRRPMRRSQR